MKRIISNKVVIGCVAYCIYRQAPMNKPRNVDKIIEHIKSYFINECKDKEHYFKCSDGYISFQIEEKDVDNFINDMLFASEDFKNLNLSQYEVDNDIKYDDENRGKFAFVSRDTYIKEYYDFIDLDACIRNICNQLFWEFLDCDLFANRCEIVYKDKSE